MLDDLNRTQPPPPPPPQNPAYSAPFRPYGYGYPTPPRRSPWFWIAVIGGGFAVVALLITAMVWSSINTLSGGDTSAFGSHIAVIDIDGVIMDADKVNKQLQKFGNDSSVKAIILHINSPGGGAAASQEVYNEVLRVRSEKHKQIVASIESVGASGAYYIASACDRIYANQASVVGSIGVIMEWTNYGDLMHWAKLKSVVIHAGELKDAGDPTRDMTPKEAAYFQALTDNMYAQFIHDVAIGRHTSDAKIQPLATGQVWTGQQSLPLGLIDKIGGFRVALTDTAKSVGISGEPSIIRPSTQKKGLAALLSGDADDLFPNPSKLLDHAPGFYFLWK
ncbi:signal peptide peptidase SppA [Granulicella sp. WH15]|uniref:signal peptide peptidase SppA n=1 Tax=Granulicella sp. WH15 TaxID=2602070 RepID=UPI001366A2AC|nr:signal peptide peptidase SppA [Granulicella sp. WH15]QHN03390.1 signal peptide peptidase SppA [Granulicella sp. WH15]